MSDYYVGPISPRDKRRQAQMDALLAQEGIARDKNLTYSAGIFDDDGQMIATGSLFGNTLRCMAVSGAHRGEGLMADIVAHLVQKQMELGHTHLFLYTKVESEKFFAPLGFTKIAQVGDKLVFMENRRDGFSRYISALKAEAYSETPGTALVMNANPFTNGHDYLLGKAAAENDRVVLFVLSEDRSLVPYADRMAMVKAAAAKYPNVTVVSSGSYMISSATFPSYFLKDDALVTQTHARLDATLFTRIAQELNLTSRYVGEEPFSAATSAYNEALRAVLPDAGVALRVIPRKEQEGTPISASHVRKLIHDGRIGEIRPLVPQTTYDYLTSDKGARALAAIKASDNVIHH
ncbi:MAG: [Clostridia bacterium]|nr:[citrate (pro-3S)-lyase] ligase [Clostridia bacterium]